MTVKRSNTFAELLVGGVGGISPTRTKLDQRMTTDPWAFVSAIDPDTKQPLVYTRDESSRDGFRAWPRDKEYLKMFFRVLDKEDRVFVEKSRQMIVSTACCLYILWDCLYHPARRWLISRSIEKDAIELLRDKIRAPWGRFPAWYKDLHRISESPQGEIKVYSTDSYIQAVTENVANRTARGGTATGLLLDEAAFQAQSREIYQAAAPMARKIFVVSTPSLDLGGAFLRAKIEEAQRGRHALEYSLTTQ